MTNNNYSSADVKNAVVTYIVDGVPIPKPRMSRSDKWKKRTCVLMYREWCDLCRRVVTGSQFKKIIIPDIDIDPICLIAINFYLPVPESWSRKKKLLHWGKVHRVRPDGDNLEKSVCDALFENDSYIPAVWWRKFYVHEGCDPLTKITILKKSQLKTEALDYNASVLLCLLRLGVGGVIL